MIGLEEQEVALKLLHTADWHLGRRFPSFDEVDQKVLMRARLDVLDRILGEAEHYAVDAVVCAGDLFDEPNPAPEWWQGLVKRFARKTDWPTSRPVFLLPGNHDPVIRTSVYWHEHPFRRELPPWVHVIDRPGFEFKLTPDAVLYAEPCQSAAGQDDLALALPARKPGDKRIRIGLIHGRTFDIEGRQNDFPIAKDAAEQRGFDYLAIGDTHSFQDVTPHAPSPIVYPGAPEPTAFDEADAGYVAVVLFLRGRRPMIKPVHVGYWSWEEHTIRDMDALRELCARPDLGQRVLRVRLDMEVTLDEQIEVERLERELKGTDANRGKVGVLQIERNLSLRTDDRVWTDSLPEILRSVVDRLEAVESLEPKVVKRAMAHLYQLTRIRHGG
jgi:DNA repair exonuclease SbcCD nuclease subunit